LTGQVKAEGSSREDGETPSFGEGMREGQKATGERVGGWGAD